MTTVPFALDCEPMWDPEPDDEDNGPWCRTLTNRSTT